MFLYSLLVAVDCVCVCFWVCKRELLDKNMCFTEANWITQVCLITWAIAWLRTQIPMVHSVHEEFNFNYNNFHHWHSDHLTSWKSMCAHQNTINPAKLTEQFVWIVHWGSSKKTNKQIKQNVPINLPTWNEISDDLINYTTMVKVV